ncbi:MAG: hypothetical protein QOE91_20, partial [Gaiellaceae bacterium]|nr:hypothetical protein [Gaiellaceae bacterium]
MSPTPRAALLVAALAPAALVLPVWLVALGAVAVIGASAADALVVRRRIEVERRVPPILARGVSAPLLLVPGPAAGRVRVRQPAPPDLRIAVQEADGPLETTVVGRRRGRHTLPAAAARVTGPLGLGRWFQRPGEEATVLVYPNLPEARRLATAVRRGRFRLDGRARGPLGLGTDFESVREYLPDDDIRQVNWRATQRLERPMSNQYRVERDRDVICLVDCGRLMAAPLTDRTRLDAAVDAAVAVAAVADAVADRVGAIAFDGELRRQVAPRRGGARRVVQALFDVEPVPVDSDYERAFAAVGDTKRAWVLVLTDLLEPTAALPLLDAVPMLARRHAVAV